MPTKLKAPFPYFGGKSQVAELVWDRFGDCDNYIEPFFGSGAVLLKRPTPPRVETVNDIDGYVANFWRATQRDPEQVAYWADNPVNEADLHARHRWLVHGDASAQLAAAVKADPDAFDAKVAGWWAWGMCCWIGSGWCAAARRAEPALKQPIQRLSDATGVNGQVWDQMPAIGDWIHEKRPHLSGRSVRDMGLDLNFVPSANRIQLADQYDIGRGVNSNGRLGTCAQRRAWLLDWFGRLRDRLRLVRVCCGDWARVCSSASTTTRLGTTAVFLDPPYSAESGRDKQLYACEDLAVAHRVRDWCLEFGGDPKMKVALCGFAGEGHEALEAAGWEAVAWKAPGGYGNRSQRGKANAARERIWFSPACGVEGSLF